MTGIDNFSSFSDELVKLGYESKTHRQLGTEMMKSFGVPQAPKPAAVPKTPAAPKMTLGQLGASAAEQADTGIRHPWLPTSSDVHSFGSRAKRDVGRQVLLQQDRAVGDVVKAIGQGGQGYARRGARGAMELGQMAHSLADISSHYEKPLAARRAGLRIPGLSDLADTTRAMSQAGGVGGLTGAFLGGIEHAEGALSGAGVDKFDPRTSKYDRLALTRSQGAGRAARRKVIRQLGLEYGMSPAQAEAALNKLLAANIPREAELAARASRDVRYLGRQVSRPGRASLRLLRFLRR